MDSLSFGELPKRFFSALLGVALTLGLAPVAGVALAEGTITTAAIKVNASYAKGEYISNNTSDTVYIKTDDKDKPVELAKDKSLQVAEITTTEATESSDKEIKVTLDDKTITFNGLVEVTDPVKIVVTAGEGTKDKPYVFSVAGKTVTFKVANGSWDDETTEDIEAPVDAITNKLTEDQIPAVGTQPNEGYKAGSWDVAPSASTEIAADTTYTYSYAAKTKVSKTVIFKVANGSWDDGTTDDKTVTLSDYEDETLKLASDQIPAVGSKPADGYKAGAWDVTPSADAEITEDATYTYTYAITYSVTKGDGATWTKGSGKKLAFTIKRGDETSTDTTYSHFSSVSVDGEELTKKTDYSVAKGSVVVSLKSAYLEKLSVGEHALTATFDDGTAEATFTVAKASVTAYTISFNANGGTGTMNNVVVVAGESVTLPANKFTRTGYTFAGWNTKADGKDGIAVTDKASVKPNSNVTLYAQWTKATTVSATKAKSTTAAASTTAVTKAAPLAKTGDDTSFVPIIILAVVGVAVVAVAFVLRRRNS